MENFRSAKPLVVVAAIALTLLSAVGIATMTVSHPDSVFKTNPATSIEATGPSSASAPAAKPAATAGPPSAQCTSPPPSSAVPVTDARQTAATGSTVSADAKEHVQHSAKHNKHQASPPTMNHAPSVVATNSGATTAPPRPVSPVCEECGQIYSIQAIQEKGQGSGLGALAGGVLGVVVGHQIGHGDGKTAATILAGAGGAYAGNEVEKTMNKTAHYEILVAMNDGTKQIVVVKTQPQYIVGEKVRVVNGVLERDHS